MAANTSTLLHDQQRLAALYRYQILDTLPEHHFDELVRLTAALCGVSIALITILDQERLRVKASFGLNLAEIPRAWTFSLHTISCPSEVTVIPDAQADLRFQEHSLVQAEPYLRFYAGAPLVTHDGYVLGTLCVFDAVPRELSALQRETLKTLAQQVVMHLEQRWQIRQLQEAVSARQASEQHTQRLVSELQRQARTLSLLEQVRTSMAQEIELSAVLRAIVEALVAVFGFPFVSIYLRDVELLRLQYQLGYDQPIEALLVSQGVLGRVARTGQPVLLTDVHSDADYVALNPAIVSELAVPLRVHGDVVGVLNVETTSAGTLSQADLALLVVLSDQASLAIERARLYENLQARLSETLLLNRVITAAASAADHIEVLNVACVELARALELPQIVCALFDEDQSELTVMSEYCAPGRPSSLGNHILRAGNMLIEQVLRQHEPVQVADIQVDPRTLTLATLFARRGTAALLLLPLIIHNEVIGIIGLESLTPRSFSQEEIALAQGIAWAVGPALENVQLTLALRIELAERSRTEAALREAKDLAEAATRTKSAFLANMSHEIRTPMNAVIGMTGLLLDTTLNSEQQEFVETIRTSGDALLAVINDILDFSKIESGKLDFEQVPFDLRDCIESALDLLAARATEKGLDLAYVVASDVPHAIISDVTRIRQILVNLVNNAVKFTSVGEVVLSVELERSEGSLHHLLFSVRDTGIGIPAARMDRLFQPFSQVDASTTRQFGGTGLGLAISRRLCELMGGTMWCESEVGKGTTFFFTVAALIADQPLRAHLRGVVPQLAGKRLLAVDDNATNRQILTTQAEGWGMRVHTTSNAREALDWLNRGERYDIVIIDLQMPEMNGAQLAAAIWASALPQRPPLVLLTPFGRREEELHAAHFAASLTKPLKSGQLFNVMLNLLADTPMQRGVPLAHPIFDASMAVRLPLRILLAEDNLINQRVALRTLARLGYRADVAANGIEVLDALARQPYDVVLMDVQMPELDGLETSQRIVHERPLAQRPYIIAMTANAMQGDRERCLAAGMDDYLSKPVRVEDLAVALERHPGLPMQAPAASPAAMLVDPAVLHKLQAYLGAGGTAMVVELVELFLSETPKQISELRQALNNALSVEVVRSVHTLKSSATLMGAHALAAMSAEFELVARQGDLDVVQTQLAEYLALYTATSAALGEILQQYASSG